MALTKKEEARVSAKVFACLSITFAVVLLVVGVLVWQNGNKAVKEVNKALTDAKISFPPAGPAFSEAVYPDSQKYAGKQVTNGELAKVYAEDFIGKQMSVASGGKTASEVAAQLAADPMNPALQQLQMMMFQGDVTKTLLLSSGYGAWTQGTMIKNIGAGLLVAAAALTVVAAGYMMRYKQLQ